MKSDDLDGPGRMHGFDLSDADDGSVLVHGQALEALLTYLGDELPPQQAPIPPRQQRPRRPGPSAAYQQRIVEARRRLDRWGSPL